MQKLVITTHLHSFFKLKSTTCRTQVPITFGLTEEGDLTSPRVEKARLK